MVLKLSYVIIVCVGTLLMCGGAQSLSREYGVKLCGREFIRAVIFTCGGSRWKRSLSEDLEPFHPVSYSDIPEEEHSRLIWPHSLDQTEELPLQFSPSTSLTDLLILLGEAEDNRGTMADVNTSIKVQKQASVLERMGEAGEPDSNINWPRRDRRKRNFSLGVAGMCCNLGCTKNDIGRLC
ncbi:hypothetical protein UPYG_G00286600 [Umbra pygmaea]|uniref:Insulin-like domain-containing protein n=1 Tax=Umbra pygmaea TaxID=75934 RepID=A0ABD0W8G3_UMBPY